MTLLGNSEQPERTSFAEFVREIEEDPEQKALLDEARERLRRELGEGDEPAMAS